MEKEIYNYLINEKKLSKIHAQGMMANIFAESNFDPAADETGDGTKGVGLFQHTFPSRKNALIKTVPDYKTNWKGQIDFALQEQEIKSYLKTKFTDKNTAATFFMNKFEKPKEELRPNRIIKHKKFLENYVQSKFTNSKSQQAFLNVLAENDLTSNQQFMTALEKNSRENTQLNYKNGAFTHKLIKQETM